MLSLFVEPEDTVTVKFVIGHKVGDPTTLYCDVDRANLIETYVDLDVSTIEEHEAVFRRPNFEDQSTIQEGIEMTGTSIRANYAAMQFRRISMLLKSWTLGPAATAAEVSKLRPLVAFVIDAQLQRLLD